MSRTTRSAHTHWLRQPKHLGSRRASASIHEDESEAGMSLGNLHQPPDAWEDKPVASRRETIRRR
jgi:hypothetical protein